MGKEQDVFERHEKKYMISGEQYNALRKQLEAKMKVDQYGKHTICNLYYDTDRYDLIRASIEKPVYKEKLRLRSYGPATKDSIVFLELKKKYQKIVYKRRVSMTLEEAKRYLNSGIHPKQECQILKEVDYFLSLYKVCLLYTSRRRRRISFRL